MKSVDLIVILLMILVVLVAIYLLAPPAAEKANLKEELRQTQLQVEALESQLQEVRGQLQKLKEKDPIVIEKIARDKFGQAREGETIYSFPREDDVKKRDE